jgi:hypothetical protein
VATLGPLQERGREKAKAEGVALEEREREKAKAEGVALEEREREKAKAERHERERNGGLYFPRHEWTSERQRMRTV